MIITIEHCRGPTLEFTLFCHTKSYKIFNLNLEHVFIQILLTINKIKTVGIIKFPKQINTLRDSDQMLVVTLSCGACRVYTACVGLMSCANFVSFVDHSPSLHACH